MVPAWDGPFPGNLRTRVLGFDLPHPVGLAAGFDKNAEAFGPLLAIAASHSWRSVRSRRGRSREIPKPRLFRLNEDAGAINRFGFNNDGVERVYERLSGARGRRSGAVGANLGANKDSTDRIADYVAVLTRLAGCVDFFTVNVSSPNTAGLRDLQERAALDALIRDVMAARDDHATGTPVLAESLARPYERTARRCHRSLHGLRKVDAIIATNTTLGRSGLRSRHRDEAGGLSGQPLFERSTAKS